MSELKSGSATLYSGTETLYNGVSELKSGTDTLSANSSKPLMMEQVSLKMQLIIWLIS